MTVKPKIISKAAKKPLCGGYLTLSFPAGPEGLVVYGLSSPPVQDAVSEYFSHPDLLGRPCRDFRAHRDGAVLVYDDITHESTVKHFIFMY